MGGGGLALLLSQAGSGDTVGPSWREPLACWFGQITFARWPQDLGPGNLLFLRNPVRGQEADSPMSVLRPE